MMADSSLSRRRLLTLCGTAAATGLAGCSTSSGPADGTDTPTGTAQPTRTQEPSPFEFGTAIFQQGFEGTPAGEIPGEWASHESRAVEVVTEASAGGAKSLKLRGKSGGCNESLAMRAVPIQDDIRIEFSVKPTSSGTVGCHDDRQARVMLRTEVGGSTYPGDGLELVTFTPDGKRVARGTNLGEYQPDTWTDVSVVYRRRADSVVQRYAFDGLEAGTVEREPTAYEDDLRAIQFQSGEFTNFWDDLTIVEL